MKILWVCNVIIPSLAEKIGLSSPVSGGWLSQVAENIRLESNCSLHVAYPQHEQHTKRDQVDGIELIPFSKVRALRRRQFAELLHELKPHVIHIFGTENVHTLDMVDYADINGVIDRVVISIQGLVSVIGRYHYFANLPARVVYACTLRDIIKQDNIYQSRQLYLRSGRFEVEAIQKVRHVIGRTDWDKACTRQLNPSINYHLCNETLRKPFYENRWSIDQCERHSIFVSQSNYPLKGFHHMLEAMAIILLEYPDAHLYTTGINPLDAKTIVHKARQTSYQRYLGSLIKRYGLEENVTFLGRLDVWQMCDAFLRAHVFASPSSIENSPNSVGEAMILGMPVVSSDVGGVKNLIEHNKEGFLYQSDAPYMMAYYVTQYFKDDHLTRQHGNKAREHALATHDPKRNLIRLMEIYRSISGI